LLVNVLGLLGFGVPLTVVGSPGGSLMVYTTGSIVRTVHAQGWGTGPQQVTGITSTTPNTGVVNTVTLAGSDARTPGHAGPLTVVSGFGLYVDHVGYGSFVSLSLTFVPEPSTLLLLAAAAGLLALHGRARMRR
jgi:hypothetical protein